MERYHDLLLHVWREACRHIEIAESAATIAAVLADRVPLGRVVVRRLDLQRATLDTVASHAVAEGGNDLAVGEPRTALSPQQLNALVAWGGERRVLRRSDPAVKSLFDLILPGAGSAEALAGPLHGPEGLAGVAGLVARPGSALAAEHEGLLGALLEPLSAALENDRRLHEMKTLREAAEAERRSLLARLGRKERAAPIVGVEAGLRHVIERVEVVCRSDVPVLLLGETGTGKEVIARAIHDRSGRHAGPFIRVNCGAIPPELIDSQLFGHERGSFTGAVDRHEGWFERADGGTLLLDEIGELTAPAQVRLLRVLQDGFIERVGGRHSVHVDVRIIAATHRDLAAMVRDGAFREDLWYRIAVFPVPIPPLRARPEDIPALACHFAEKAATRFGLPLVMPTPEDVAALSAYPWPGNVRELGTVIDRAALLGNGRRLEIATSLGAVAPAVGDRAVIVGEGPGERPRDERRRAAAPTGGDVSTFDDAVRATIEAALRSSRGRVDGPFGAAAALRVNANTLRARMRRMGINAKRFRG